MNEIIYRIDLFGTVLACIVFGAFAIMLFGAALGYVTTLLERAELFAKKAAEVACRKVTSRFRSAA